MQIEHGLMAGQVLQRDKRGVGRAVVRGGCAPEGDVQVCVHRASKRVGTHGWQTIGVAVAGRFDGTVDGLPTGGPYQLELRVVKGRKTLATMRVRDVFVGDVWILAGQSNMEGVGNLTDAPGPHPMVRAYFMRDEWGLAEEKLHYLEEAVDSVHNRYGDEPGRPPQALLAKGRKALIKGTSPGLAFGIEMHKRTGVPQGLIACAHGGTSMAQWSPALRDKGGGSLYGAMMRRYEKLGQAVAGVLWYQGESDANRKDAGGYTQNMVNLIESTRRDMALPKLPWFIVQLGCHAAAEDGEFWNRIQEQQRHLPTMIKYVDVAPAIDLELDDGIHISGKSHHILGRRLARLADRLVHKARDAKPGIALKAMALVTTPDCNPGAACMSVKLTYGNVAGRLVSLGRPAGFVLLDVDGHDTNGIYKTTLHGNSVLLHTNMIQQQLERLTVSYGHGRNPYCNITDSEGMSIPAMQTIPVPVEKDRMPDWHEWETARLRGVDSIAKVSLALARKASGWRKAPLRNPFGVLPKAPEDMHVGVYAMKTRLVAGDKRDALLVFGANVPFKMWLNGKPVCTDPLAGVPMEPTKYTLPCRLKKGENDLLVACAPAGAGAHFGICLRVGNPAGKADPRISW